MIDKNEIIILDDVIPKVQQDKIESLLLGHRTSWVYMHDIALSKEDMARNGITQRTPGMASYFNDELIKYHNKFMFDEMKIIAHAAAKKINFPLKKILASRSFLHFPTREELHKKYDNVHVDHTFDHLVCLYYVNDTDGDTFIFNKKIDSNEVKVFDNELKIQKRISPKKGRLILFDSTYLHTGSPPRKHKTRLVLNFVFFKEKTKK